jgi:uncharacterized protein with von Willebrand factor type A (vWA) domain
VVRDEGGGASRSTEPATGTSAATDVSLREYLMAAIQAEARRSDARFDAMQQAVDAAFASSQRAIDKTNEALEARFEGVNEFRATLSDQASNFVTKDALASLTDKLQAAIDQNRKDLDALEKRLDLKEGQEAGSRLTTGTLVTVITVGVGVIGLIVVIVGVLSR